MLKLNEHELTVDQVPPNRAFLVHPHFPVWAGLSLVYRSAFYGYHQRGEVMRARYPDQVGGDNLDIQSSYVTRESPFGTMLSPRLENVATCWPVSGGHKDTKDGMSVVP